MDFAPERDRIEGLHIEHYLNRLGPPDIPMTRVFEGIAPLPDTPPISRCERGLECWRMIADTQRTAGGTRWISATDAPYVHNACHLHARWREVRERLDAYRAEGGSDIYDTGTNQVCALYRLEASLLAQYQKALVSLGVVPTRRAVSMDAG